MIVLFIFDSVGISPMPLRLVIKQHGTKMNKRMVKYTKITIRQVLDLGHR